MFRSAALLLGATPFLAEGKKQCPEGTFNTKNTGVQNLCQKHFPDKTSEKAWLIMYYAPWCGHCKAMKPAFEALGKEFKDNNAIGIAGVNCDAEANKALCGQQGVQGFPTVKTMVNGKSKPYNGARDKPAMQAVLNQMLKKKGTSGGSAKCPKGLFKSGIKDAIVPMCDAHFPNEKSKNSWVLVYYNKEQMPPARKEDLNRVAEALGNEPPERSKAKRKNKKQKELMADFVERYEIKSELVKKAKGSKDPIVKFGSVCCDCETKLTTEKCAGKTTLGESEVIEFYDADKKSTVTYPSDGGFNALKFAPWIFDTLGYTKPAKEEL